LSAEFLPPPDPTGWATVQDARDFPPSKSYVSGEPDGNRIRVVWWVHDDGRFTGHAWFGKGAVGPPGHAHGGSMAALLDEAMGVAAWAAGFKVVAAHLNLNFRHMLPLGSKVFVPVTCTRVSPRKIEVTARLEHEDGTVYADGVGLFVELRPEVLAKLGEEEEKQVLSPF